MYMIHTVTNLVFLSSTPLFTSSLYDGLSKIVQSCNGKVIVKKSLTTEEFEKKSSSFVE